MDGCSFLAEFIKEADARIWGVLLMFLLVGTGLFLSFRLSLIQFRGFRHGIRVLRGEFDDEKDAGEITHFQALSAALSATIGTGNIVGVATAILMGGPGAVFWMWITALVGMATKFTSCTLAVHYRRIDDTGEAHGGPMHYIELGMGKRYKWLAVFFALVTIAASFGIGNMFQINNVAVSVNTLFRGDAKPLELINWLVGGGFALVVGVVIVGGIKSIGKFASKIVPFMCLFYFCAGMFILIRNMGDVPGAFGTIIYFAFHKPEALAGGLIGTVIQQGVARGLFSNEAGLGSAAMVHGAARTDEPVREGLVAMLGPFIDTIIICSVTGLVIVVTGAYNIVGIQKTVLTGTAFSIGLGTDLGAKLVSLGVIFFSFSTLISWSYYGDRAADYLFGKKAVVPYRLIYLCFIVIGAVAHYDIIINFCDAMNGLMAIPNLVALLVLSPVVVKLTRDYMSRNVKKQ